MGLPDSWRPITTRFVGVGSSCSGHRKPRCTVRRRHELGVGVALRVGVPEVHGGVRWTEQRWTEFAIVVPVARNQPISRITEEELRISIALRVTVAEVHESGRFAVQPHSLAIVAVEVSHERFVAGIPEHIRRLCCTESSIVFAELVDYVERLVGWSVDRQRVIPVAVEVASDRDVTGIPKEELDIRDALRI
jgi:hypothetical protein